MNGVNRSLVAGAAARVDNQRTGPVTAAVHAALHRIQDGQILRKSGVPIDFGESQRVFVVQPIQRQPAPLGSGADYVFRSPPVSVHHPAPIHLIGDRRQFLFSRQESGNRMDILASDLERFKALDLGLLGRGVHLRPNVRRFVSAVHTEQDFVETPAALDAACAAA